MSSQCHQWQKRCRWLSVVFSTISCKIIKSTDEINSPLHIINSSVEPDKGQHPQENEIIQYGGPQFILINSPSPFPLETPSADDQKYRLNHSNRKTREGGKGKKKVKIPFICIKIWLIIRNEGWRKSPNDDDVECDEEGKLGFKYFRERAVQVLGASGNITACILVNVYRHRYSPLVSRQSQPSIRRSR